MKNLFKTTLLLVTAGALLFSCRPMDSDSHKLGPAPKEDQLAFTATPSTATPNIIELQNNSSVSGVALWDLGNGTTVKGDKVSASYPFKGDYTITMSLYTTGGGASISKVITIAEDDYSLLDTPGFNALTGGADATDGKTWVFARYTKGHFGVGDVNAAPEEGGPAWWQCDPKGKEGCSLYENEFTFIQKGTKLIWKNEGNIYTNENGMNHLGIPGTANPVVGDFDVPYVPADNLTFTLDEDNMLLTLSGGAFLGFYTGKSEFHIITLNEHQLEVWCGSEAEPGNAWYFKFVPKDELVEPEVDPEPEPDPKPDSEPAWFRPAAPTNLMRSSIDYEQWFSGDDWAGGLTAGIAIKNDIVITVPEGVGGGEWMGQFKIKTHIPADARERFDFSCQIKASNAGTATVKMTNEADPSNDSYFYDGNVAIGAGETLLFEAPDHMMFDAHEGILLVFDFGRFEAGTVITLSDFCLQKHIPLSDKPEVVNLWPTAEVSVEELFFSDPSWGGGLDPKFTPGEGNKTFELTVPEGIGGGEWMGQVKLSTNIALQASHEYEFSCKVEATEASSFTIKLTNFPEADTKVCFYDNSLPTKNGVVTIRKQGFSPASEDVEAAFLVFDFGRTPAGTVIKVSDIVLQEYVY